MRLSPLQKHVRKVVGGLGKKVRLSRLQKHVKKAVGGFGKKSCVSTSVRKPGNTCASPTAMI